MNKNIQLKSWKKNPMLCVEALGYLKALNTYFPSEQKWIVSKKSELLAILLFYTL